MLNKSITRNNKDVKLRNLSFNNDNGEYDNLIGSSIINYNKNIKKDIKSKLKYSHNDNNNNNNKHKNKLKNIPIPLSKNLKKLDPKLYEVDMNDVKNKLYKINKNKLDALNTSYRSSNNSKHKNTYTYNNLNNQTNKNKESNIKYKLSPLNDNNVIEEKDISVDQNINANNFEIKKSEILINKEDTNNNDKAITNNNENDVSNFYNSNIHKIIDENNAVNDNISSITEKMSVINYNNNKEIIDRTTNRSNISKIYKNVESNENINKSNVKSNLKANSHIKNKSKSNIKYSKEFKSKDNNISNNKDGNESNYHLRRQYEYKLNKTIKPIDNKINTEKNNNLSKNKTKKYNKHLTIIKSKKSSSNAINSKSPSKKHSKNKSSYKTSRSKKNSDYETINNNNNLKTLNNNNDEINDVSNNIESNSYLNIAKKDFNDSKLAKMNYLSNLKNDKNYNYSEYNNNDIMNQNYNNSDNNLNNHTNESYGNLNKNILEHMINNENNMNNSYYNSNNYYKDNNQIDVNSNYLLKQKTALKQIIKNNKCLFCLKSLNKPIILKCGHFMCLECAAEIKLLNEFEKGDKVNYINCIECSTVTFIDIENFSNANNENDKNIDNKIEYNDYSNKEDILIEVFNNLAIDKKHNIDKENLFKLSNNNNNNINKTFNDFNLLDNDIILKHVEEHYSNILGFLNDDESKDKNTVLDKCLCEICPGNVNIMSNPDDNPEIIAEHECLNCDVIMCFNCKLRHLANPRHQTHKIVNFNSNMTSKYNKIQEKTESALCELHKEPLKLFCITENIPCCLVCTNYDNLHGSHDVKSIKYIVDNGVIEFSLLTREAEPKVRQIESFTSELLTVKQNLIEENMFFKNKLNNMIENIISMIKKKQQEINKDLEEIFSYKIRDLTRKINSFTVISQKFNFFKTFNTERDLDILKKVKRMEYLIDKINLLEDKDIIIFNNYNIINNELNKMIDRSNNNNNNSNNIKTNIIESRNTALKENNSLRFSVFLNYPFDKIKSIISNFSFLPIAYWNLKTLKDTFLESNTLPQNYITSDLCSILPKIRSGFLLYKLSRDGASPEVFHKLCDNKGANILIVRTTDNYIFGGFNPLSWINENMYNEAEDAFIFSVTDGKYRPPIKCPVKYNKKEFAIKQSVTEFSPGFGVRDDADLFIAFKNLSASYSKLDKVYHCPEGYNSEEFLAGKKTDWDIVDIEVYSVDVINEEEYKNYLRINV